MRLGRVGHTGQPAADAALGLRNRRVASLGGRECARPAPDDQLVLQGVEKVVARRAFHLTDVLFTIATIRRGGDDLDWDYVIATARALGVRGGLSWYLQPVHGNHARPPGRGTPPRDQRPGVG